MLLATQTSSISPTVGRLVCLPDGLDTFTTKNIFTSLLTQAISLQAARPKQRVKKRKLVFLHSSPDYCRYSPASLLPIISVFPVNYLNISIIFCRSPQYSLSRMNTSAGYKGVVGRTCETDPNR